MKAKNLKNITAAALAAAFALTYINYGLGSTALAAAGVAVMLVCAAAVLIEKK